MRRHGSTALLSEAAQQPAAGMMGCSAGRRGRGIAAQRPWGCSSVAGKTGLRCRRPGVPPRAYSRDVGTPAAQLHGCMLSTTAATECSPVGLRPHDAHLQQAQGQQRCRVGCKRSGGVRFQARASPRQCICCCAAAARVTGNALVPPSVCCWVTRSLHAARTHDGAALGAHVGLLRGRGRRRRRRLRTHHQGGPAGRGACMCGGGAGRAVRGGGGAASGRVGGSCRACPLRAATLSAAGSCRPCAAREAQGRAGGRRDRSRRLPMAGDTHGWPAAGAPRP